MKRIIERSEATMSVDDITKDTKIGILMKNKKHVIMKVIINNQMTFFLIDSDFMGARTTFTTKKALVKHVLETPDYISSKPEERGAFSFDNGKELLKWLTA